MFERLLFGLLLQFAVVCVTVKASSLVGHPSIWIPRAGKSALNLLRLTLLGEV
ncbi:MAG: hypothetical protein WD063_12285 [Pirellulales bacterium]